ncbi:alpha/beta hydrolase [Allostreptomyces psammosilenae]|uniref:DUF1023 domain-containing protein n=1 Tax=Allostreptomyces psammosilenae TaxID=1892865 RepID=A0A852ZQK8_9ACTN|nr:alpha/beta hydrolase [Allostreptomyces psammosilenae]NYI03560.1 hypothetical protein [Allostreptomyces psammosilenae]
MPRARWIRTLTAAACITATAGATIGAAAPPDRPPTAPALAADLAAWQSATIPGTAGPGTTPGTPGTPVTTITAVTTATAATADGRELPDPLTASPAEISAFFSTLTPAEADTLARTHPYVVGNLDGAPIHLRYLANRLALTDSADRARTSGDTATADKYAALAAPGRSILSFDPSGRGLVAEVYGDLATAERVSVVVPGSDADLARFDRTSEPLRSARGMAEALHTRQLDTAPAARTAVIAWTGYLTPNGFGANVMRGDLAADGALRLERLLDGLAAARDAAPATADAGPASTALFCHSYGAVLCGLAAPHLPAQVDDIVVLAAPGMRADTVADLHTSAHVWAVRSADDWIDRVPNVAFAGFGHGADPVDDSFGARLLAADGAVGHSGYFAAGTASLTAFTEISLGHYQSVPCAHDDQANQEECRDGLV